MEFSKLSSTVSIKTVSEDSQRGVFEIEGLFSGYGVTVGNSLRRVLLSSLPGAAVTEIKIKNAPATIAGAFCRGTRRGARHVLLLCDVHPEVSRCLAHMVIPSLSALSD